MLVRFGPTSCARTPPTEQIEKGVGFPLEWQELPRKKESRIEIRRSDCDPTNQNGWHDQHEWIAERLDALYRVFSPRVKALDASELEIEEASQSATSSNAARG